MTYEDMVNSGETGWQRIMHFIIFFQMVLLRTVTSYKKKKGIWGGPLPLLTGVAYKNHMSI